MAATNLIFSTADVDALSEILPQNRTKCVCVFIINKFQQTLYSSLEVVESNSSINGLSHTQKDEI